MDNLSVNVQLAIQFLIYSTVLMFIIVSVFIVKLLIDLSNLTKSIDNILLTVKYDIGPTIKELKKALINVNSIANRTDTQFQDLSKAISGTINAFSGGTQSFSNKAKFVFSSLKKGVFAGLKVFFEENKTKS